MGRNIPVAHTDQSNHPVIAYSIFIACIAATIAIVSSLCGGLSRKKSKPTSVSESKTKCQNPEDVDHQHESSDDHDQGTQARDTISISTSMITNLEDKNGETFSQHNHDQDSLKQPLPPPPAMQAATSHHHHRSQSHSSAPSQGRRLTSNMSQGNLFSSMSMRNMIGYGMSSSRQSSRRDQDHNNNKKHDKKLKNDQDSIWKKQIILGEKCRVPDEDDDTVLYDEKGNKISTYHPRIPSPLPISRQTSDVDVDAIPKKEG